MTTQVRGPYSDEEVRILRRLVPGDVETEGHSRCLLSLDWKDQRIHDLKLLNRDLRNRLAVLRARLGVVSE